MDNRETTPDSSEDGHRVPTPALRDDIHGTLPPPSPTSDKSMVDDHRMVKGVMDAEAAQDVVKTYLAGLANNIEDSEEEEKKSLSPSPPSFHAGIEDDKATPYPSPPLEYDRPSRKVRVRFDYMDHMLTIEQKSNTPLGRSFEVFAREINLERALLRFTYNGVSVRDDETPVKLGMTSDSKDRSNNQIQVFLQQEEERVADIARRVRDDAHYEWADEAARLVRDGEQPVPPRLLAGREQFGVERAREALERAVDGAKVERQDEDLLGRGQAAETELVAPVEDG
uniref:Ubiquitin-like domain-containing protein n=1 Tax=Mycena chlorophos TaxID=658473 RepID=A0ABQ0L6M6_MYCCL|nr:predicted protein [Mycena chlorophos]